MKKYIVCIYALCMAFLPILLHAEANTIPDFQPVSEDLSPLKTRLVSISARSTPLRDVLHVIAEATGLNLVVEKGVDPETPVTLTLKNISAEEALNTIFMSANYFYTIKENMLIVKAVDTRVFELGQPAVTQEYSVDVGGDILGGTSSGSGSTTTTTTNLKGNVSQKIQGDKDSFKFWDSIDKTLANILGISAPGAAGHASQTTLSSYNINRMTGTIIVTATKRDIERVEKYLSEIKKVLNRQVVVEARIVEVQLSEGLKYGIDWSALDFNSFGQVTVGTTNFSNIVSSDLPTFQVGVSRWDFNGLLQALQSQGDVKVLSNPRVNIMNGQTALLSVGRNVNFISKVETTTTSGTTAVPTTTFSVQTSSVLSGIIIGIVPHINEQGEISMAVTPIVTDLVKLEDRNIGRVGDNTIQISLPTIDLRELSTTVKMRDGNMVVIGGLIQNKDRTVDNQVPFLGDIPIIGYLFKSREQRTDKTELIIMLKPTIVGTETRQMSN